MVPDTPPGTQKVEFLTHVGTLVDPFLEMCKTIFGNITRSHLPEHEARFIATYDPKAYKMTAFASALNSTCSRIRLKLNVMPNA